MLNSHDRQIDPPQLARDLRYVLWGAWLVAIGDPLVLIFGVGLALGAVGVILLAVGYFKCRRASTWGLLSHLLLVNVLPAAFVLSYFDDEWGVPLVLAWFPWSTLVSSFPFLKFMRRVSNKLAFPLPSSKFYAVIAAIVLAVSAAAFMSELVQPGSTDELGGVIIAGFVLLICLPMLVWFALRVTRFRRSVVETAAA